MATRDTMTDRDTATLARNWWLLAIRGAAALVFGILAFVTPGITLAVLVLYFGAYAVIDGIVNIVMALRKRERERPWWQLLIEGVVSVAAGVVAFVWPGISALTLVYLIAAWAIVTGASGWRRPRTRPHHRCVRRGVRRHAAGPGVPAPRPA
jgi:uncharacterized membrane protein HdeD (DUF308 family)